VRRPRKNLPPQGIYHVTTRGVARTAIFLDDDERRLFLHLLAARSSAMTGASTPSA